MSEIIDFAPIFSVQASAQWLAIETGNAFCVEKVVHAIFERTLDLSVVLSVSQDKNTYLLPNHDAPNPDGIRHVKRVVLERSPAVCELLARTIGGQKLRHAASQLTVASSVCSTVTLQLDADELIFCDLGVTLACLREFSCLHSREEIDATIYRGVLIGIIGSISIAKTKGRDFNFQGNRLNQSSAIEHLLEHYGTVPGVGKNNLQKVFADVNRILQSLTAENYNARNVC